MRNFMNEFKLATKCTGTALIVLENKMECQQELNNYNTAITRIFSILDNNAEIVEHWTSYTSVEKIVKSIDSTLEQLGTALQLFANPLVSTFIVNYFEDENVINFSLITKGLGHHFNIDFDSVEELIYYLTGINKMEEVSMIESLWEEESAEEVVEDLWDLDEELEEEVINKVVMKKITTKKDLQEMVYIPGEIVNPDSDSTANYSKRVLEALIKSPFIFDDSDYKYDLRDGHMLYIKNNGQLGFGVNGKQHCINGLILVDDKVVLSNMSIGGNVDARSKDKKVIEDILNQYNKDYLFEGGRLNTVIYFA